MYPRSRTPSSALKNVGFDVGDILIINEETGTELQDIFAQISNETTLDEYIDFDTKIITSEPAVYPTHVDWRQDCREKSIAEVLQLEDTVLINDSYVEIVDDEQDVRKVTASEALDAVKFFAETHEDKQMNVMLNKLIGKVETRKL